jgi:putative aldouronate transport system substrate-binding protein
LKNQQYPKKTMAALSLLMFATILTACDLSVNDAAPVAPEAEATTLARSKPTLRALHLWQKEDYGTYPVAKMIEERSGYPIKYDMLPQGDQQNKLNLLIYSGEPYDYVLVNGSSNWKALYSDYARKGALVELGPLIDKYGPNIKAAISDESWDALKVNGKIYAIPTRANEFVDHSLIIRQDWLDKLNLKMPTTVDEFVSVLRAFRDMDPGGNGNLNVPFTIHGEVPMIANLSGAFGMPNNWNDVGGRLVPRQVDPNFKSYLKFVQELYNEQLLDRDFPVNKAANVMEKFTSGRAGVIQASWTDVPLIADTLPKNILNATYAFLPPLKGKEGMSGLSSNGGGFDRLSFVPKSSRYPEHVIRMMNAKLEKETFKQITIGEEGKHFTYKDGVYTPIQPKFSNELNYSNNFLTGIDELLYPVYWQARLRKDERMFAAWDFLNAQTPAEAKVADPLGMAPYLVEYSRNNQKLLNMTYEYSVKIIVGAESLTGLEAFQQEYKLAGGEASQLEINEWYETKHK